GIGPHVDRKLEAGGATIHVRTIPVSRSLRPRQPPQDLAILPRMAVQQVRDRRGRAARGKAGLLDRDLTLHAISDALESVGADAGQAILMAGHPGMGKTRLYEAAIDEGRARGFRVLHAAGSELEQTLAFGVAGQLLR